MFKAIGYLISSVSVILLGIAAWDGVKAKPVLLAVLIAGIIASIAGMAMRWISFLRDEKPSQWAATASLRSWLNRPVRPVPAPDRGSGEPRPKDR